MCVSGSNYCRTTCHITAGKYTIDSQECMTLLGFCFGDRPTDEKHVDFICKKFNARSWIPRHLKSAGVPLQDNVKIYNSTIRSVIEYAVPVYHTLLSATMSNKMERESAVESSQIYTWCHDVLQESPRKSLACQPC